MFIKKKKVALKPDLVQKCAYPDCGAAVKSEGLDLPILQEHLQHIGYE